VDQGLDFASSAGHGKLVDDEVSEEDLFTYAKSLINAVLTLHQNKILQCHIRPGNALRSKVTKTASLVDFGRAQYEECATAYPGTKLFTDPWFKR
jgi:serine/threonine protein kinase